MLGTIARNRGRVLGHGGEGYRSLRSMIEAGAAQRARCSEVEAKGAGVLFVAQGDGLAVDLGGTVGADRFTPWALRQVGSIAGVPAGVVDRLTPATAARVLNETWPRDGEEGGPRRFLLESGAEGSSTLRAVVSPTYRRVWDSELFGEVERWLVGGGWEPAYPTINSSAAEEDRERALWRSDRDSFAFFMSARNEGDNGADGLGGLRRGLFVGNSEVGARSLVWGTMWFRDLCANFLLWGASQVERRARRHTAGVVGEVGNLRRWMREACPTVTAPDLDPFVILNRTTYDVPAGDDGETWEDRFARSVAERFGVTQAAARKAATIAAEGDAGARPGSYWAVVNGLTAAARDLTPGDRFELSAAAGKVASAGLKVAGVGA